VIESVSMFRTNLVKRSFDEMTLKVCLSIVCSSSLQFRYMIPALIMRCVSGQKVLLDVSD